jgi:hypothetical protein
MFSRSNWIELELRRRNNRYKIAFLTTGISQVVPIGYSADLKLEILVSALSRIRFERRTL